jgi:hypothetical protein
MLHSPDIWLTSAQAVYFFATGDNLVEVSRLSHEVVISRLARLQSASVPLSADAGPEERAAALKEVKGRLGAAGESPCAVAIKWRDHLVATGLVAAEGRRGPSSLYETIKPVEFGDLRFADPHAENAKGEIVFYNVRMSGWDLWRARQLAMASDDMAPSMIDSVKVPSDQLPPHVGEKSSTDDEDEPNSYLHAAIGPQETRPGVGSQRMAYRGPLEAWMAQQELPVLRKMGPAAIASAFKSYSEQHSPELVPLLPKRLRSMENVIERIINRRIDAVRTKPRRPNPAGNGQ